MLVTHSGLSNEARVGEMNRWESGRRQGQKERRHGWEEIIKGFPYKPHEDLGLYCTRVRKPFEGIDQGLT